jgi:hypothetical protein
MWIFFIFWPSKIRISPTDIVSSLFPPRCRLSSGQRCHAVTLPFHGAKTSSLHPFHLLVTLRPVTSHLEPKLKHWIRTIAADHPPQTTRLSPSTAIKSSSQTWSLSPPLNHVSIFIAVPRPLSLCTTTPTVIN